MRKRLFLAALAGFAVTPAVRADSIWDRREPKSAFLFQDLQARGVGDILTIAITETTTTNDREQRAGDRRNRNDVTGALNYNYQFGQSPGSAGTGNLAMNSDVRRRFDGTAQLTSNRQFVDRMAVTVVDVLPNGNLVFEGYRTRAIAGEERALRLTGVVRPADIAAGNTVQSQFVANFKISYVGRGAQSEFANQTLLARIVNYIIP